MKPHGDRADARIRQGQGKSTMNCALDRIIVWNKLLSGKRCGVVVCNELHSELYVTYYHALRRISKIFLPFT